MMNQFNPNANQYPIQGANALQPGYSQMAIPGFAPMQQPGGYAQPGIYPQVGQNQNKQFDLSMVNSILMEAAPQEKIETPTGTYQVRVREIKFAKSQNTQNPMIYWQLEHISGQYQKAIEHTYDVIPLNLDLDNPDNVDRLRKKFEIIKGKFKTLGVETNSVRQIEDFQNLFPQVLDATLEIRKIVKGENSNIYFNKKINTGGPGNNFQGQIPGFFQPVQQPQTPQSPQNYQQLPLNSASKDQAEIEAASDFDEEPENLPV